MSIGKAAAVCLANHYISLAWLSWFSPRVRLCRSRGKCLCFAAHPIFIQGAGPGIGPAPGSQVGGRLREEGPLPADGGERMAQTKVQIGRL